LGFRGGPFHLARAQNCVEEPVRKQERTIKQNQRLGKERGYWGLKKPLKMLGVGEAKKTKGYSAERKMGPIETERKN